MSREEKTQPFSTPPPLPPAEKHEDAMEVHDVESAGSAILCLAVGDDDEEQDGLLQRNHIKDNAAEPHEEKMVKLQDKDTEDRTPQTLEEALSMLKASIARCKALENRCKASENENKKLLEQLKEEKKQASVALEKLKEEKMQASVALEKLKDVHKLEKKQALVETAMASSPLTALLTMAYKLSSQGSTALASIIIGMCCYRSQLIRQKENDDDKPNDDTEVLDAGVGLEARASISADDIELDEVRHRLVECVVANLVRQTW
jgi:hypothetical protein